MNNRAYDVNPFYLQAYRIQNLMTFSESLNIEIN